MKRRMPWEPKKDPVKGPRSVKDKAKKAKARAAIKQVGAYGRRTRKAHDAFVKAVHERDKPCQGERFVLWLYNTGRDEAHQKMIRGFLAFGYLNGLEVHHVFKRSTHRHLAQEPANGALIAGWVHRCLDDTELYKLFQVWWLEVHPEFKEVLQK